METEKEKTTLETLTSETPKTRFCQKCDQEITRGKEIKIENEVHKNLISAKQNDRAVFWILNQ